MSLSLQKSQRMPKLNTRYIVAHRSIFLRPNVCEQIHQFPSSTKKDARKTKPVPFFCLIAVYKLVSTNLFVGRAGRGRGARRRVTSSRGSTTWPPLTTWPGTAAAAAAASRLSFSGLRVVATATRVVCLDKHALQTVADRVEAGLSLWSAVDRVREGVWMNEPRRDGACVCARVSVRLPVCHTVSAARCYTDAAAAAAAAAARHPTLTHPERAHQY